MSESPPNVAERLDALAAEFAELEPRERLELLLEFAESLPPLPEQLRAEQERQAHRVHECQTPVFLWVEVRDGRVHIDAEVAPEAPTVKGFVNILVTAFRQAPAKDVLAVEPNLVHRLGLVEALGMMRMRGLQAIQAYIRKQVQLRDSAEPTS